jgi:uncharacterized membrane protein YoaK (UPF0700 family)
VRHGGVATALRRVLAVLAMFAGAAIGSLVVLHTRITWALGLVAVVMSVVVFVASLQSRRPMAWQRP